MNLEFVFPEETDWCEFLAVADEEGWRVPATELALFRGPLADSVLALREQGQFAGLVTFVLHGGSAWIGNLIIRPDFRGRGFGKRLFKRAMHGLVEKKAGSIWLTASDSGFPLYQSQGFETVGRVERWVLKGERVGMLFGPGGEWSKEEEDSLTEILRRADSRTWGGTRLLLDLLLKTGRPIACGGSAALLQREPGMQILGPWYKDGANENDHRLLLKRAIASARPGEELVADVFAGALPPQILKEAGFALKGDARLMVKGNMAGIDLNNLVSFASLGSMG